jgi:hypothetical protein
VGWLERFLGFSSGDGNGAHYLFWSGIGGILERALELAVIGWVLLRRHNCHQPRCWRMGRFPVEGTTWTACHRHHPNPPTKETIQQRYHLYAGRRPGRG